jgi:hypothetical protein
VTLSIHLCLNFCTCILTLDLLFFFVCVKEFRHWSMLMFSRSSGSICAIGAVARARTTEERKWVMWRAASVLSPFFVAVLLIDCCTPRLCAPLPPFSVADLLLLDLLASVILEFLHLSVLWFQYYSVVHRLK